MASHDDCLCPHMDKGDARCAGRFSLGGIEGAFDTCVSGWLACPHFHRIAMEESFQARVADGDAGIALWYETVLRQGAQQAQATRVTQARQAVTVSGRAVEVSGVRSAV